VSEIWQHTCSHRYDILGCPNQVRNINISLLVAANFWINVPTKGRPCLLPPKNKKKIIKIFCHIESYDICMKY